MVHLFKIAKWIAIIPTGTFLLAALGWLIILGWLQVQIDKREEAKCS